MGNIHMKLYEIWTSGSEVVKRKCLRTDGQGITIANLEPSPQVS